MPPGPLPPTADDFLHHHPSLCRFPRLLLHVLVCVSCVPCLPVARCSGSWRVRWPCVQTYLSIIWISGGVRTPPLTSVLRYLTSRRVIRPSLPMHYIGRRAPAARPGAVAAKFSKSARPEAATTHSTQGLSSTMTSHVKTRSETIIRRPHGGVRAAERVRERRPGTRHQVLAQCARIYNCQSAPQFHSFLIQLLRQTAEAVPSTSREPSRHPRLFSELVAHASTFVSFARQAVTFALR